MQSLSGVVTDACPADERAGEVNMLSAEHADAGCLMSCRLDADPMNCLIGDRFPT